MGSELGPGPERVVAGEKNTSGRVKGAQSELDWDIHQDVQCRKTYTNETRIDILRLKRTEWVPAPELGHRAKRKPTWEEIERWTGIPKNTASKWAALEDEILLGRGLEPQNNSEDKCRPDLEEGSLQHFREQPAKDDAVRQDWFGWKSTTDVAADDVPADECVRPDERQPREDYRVPQQRERKPNALWDVPARAHALGELSRVQKPVIGPKNNNNYRTKRYLPPEDELWDLPARAHTNGEIPTPTTSAAFWWSQEAWNE